MDFWICSLPHIVEEIVVYTVNWATEVLSLMVNQKRCSLLYSILRRTMSNFLISTMMDSRILSLLVNQRLKGNVHFSCSTMMGKGIFRMFLNSCPTNRNREDKWHCSITTTTVILML